MIGSLHLSCSSCCFTSFIYELVDKNTNIEPFILAPVLTAACNNTGYYYILLMLVTRLDTELAIEF